MKRNRTIGTGILVLAVFILNTIVRYIPAEMFGSGLDPYLAAAILQFFIFAFPSLIYLKLRPECDVKRIRLRLPKSRHIVFMVSVFFAMVSGSALINYFMSSLIGSDYSSSSASYMSIVAGGGVSGGIYAVLAFALIPALCEEFLFRGIVAAEYECSGIPSAVFFSTVLFAMSHLSFMRLPVYLFSGLMLVFALYVTRSVIATMIIHASFNTCALFFEELVYRVVNRQGIVLFLFALAVVFLLSLVFAFGEGEKIYSYYGVLNIESPHVPSKKERLSFVEALISPPFIAVTVFYIIMGAIS